MTLKKLLQVLHSVATPVVKVTGVGAGDPIAHSVANGSTATVRLTVRQDGKIFKLEGGTSTQINTNTDWIIPNNGNDNLYEVQYTKGIFDDTPTGGVALNTWFFILVDRSIEYVETANDTELTGTITAHIRYNGGPEIDSGGHVMQATVGLPI